MATGVLVSSGPCGTVLRSFELATCVESASSTSEREETT